MAESTGDRIRRLREERRWSQSALAGLLNVSSKTISNWERGRHIPRASLGALEKLFDAPLDEVDPVEAAIQASSLSRGDKHKLVGLYYDMLDGGATRDQTG